jgi:hypothetical protein
MTISHSSIPDGKRHEPKGASTAVTRSVYHSDGAGSGSWRKTSDLDIDYSVKANNKFGWNDVSGNLYTSGSPRAISSGARTQLTNNGLAAQTDTSRLGVLWNTSLNQFLINDLNAFYRIRVNLKAKTSSGAGTPYTLLFELQSDNGPTVIQGITQTIKGGSYVNHLSLPIEFYNGSFINNQPLKLFVTPDANIDIYDIGFVITRSYVES